MKKAGRPQAFDRDEAIQAAMELFWRRGYAGTSTADLLQAMGLGRGSLYNTFGSKQALFLACLDRYTAVLGAPLLQLLDQAPSGREAIEMAFRGSAEQFATPAGEVGCLMSVTAVEVALTDPEARSRVQHHLQTLEHAFAQALQRAQQAGELPSTHSTPDLARFLAQSTLGLGAYARLAPGREALHSVAATLLSTLDAPPLETPHEMVHAVVIRGSRSEIYRALTTAEGLCGWWTNDVEAEPRERTQALFGFGGRSVVFHMRIDTLVPNQHVAWTCLGSPEEWVGTQLSFALHPGAEPHTIEVRFRHRGWRRTDGAFGTCNTTWGHLMHHLKRFVETGVPRPFFVYKPPQ